MSVSDKIGRYEVLEEIGSGTFAILYKCHDPDSDELVALKVCRSQDEDVLARFSREAEIAIALDHPNIVRVLDFGTSDEGPFLVEELLDGQDLDERIESGDSLSSSTRVEILLQIAQGLAYSHAEGVLHRDVTPSNVRVLDDGRVKLMDFGLARSMHSDVRSTRAGDILGTAGYLPPERVLGEAADERADIFSFGVLAYYLLSGSKPFLGRSLKELLREVVSVDPPPLSARWPDCPDDLETLVSCCLAKRADRRYRSFSDVIADLASIAAELRLGGDQLQPAEAPEPSKECSELEHGTVPLSEGVNSVPNRWLRLLRHRLRRVSEGLLALSVPYRWAAGAGLVLLLITGSWWSLGRQIDAEEVLAAPPGAPAAAASQEGVAPPAASKPGGQVLLVALPWGEVESLSHLDGRQIGLPDERATPLVLSLDAGDYRVEMRHPSSEEPRVCYLKVGEESPVVCRVEFFDVEPEEYFRETGWWR